MMRKTKSIPNDQVRCEDGTTVSKDEKGQLIESTIVSMLNSTLISIKALMIGFCCELRSSCVAN